MIVLSGAPLDLAAVDGVVEQMGGEPSAIVDALAKRGLDHIYVDGGVTVQRFLRALASSSG